MVLVPVTKLRQRSPLMLKPLVVITPTEVGPFTVSSSQGGYELRAEGFSHCPTVCAYEGGALIAFYTGREGTEQQRVVVVRWDRRSRLYSLIATFPGGTGNPVIWQETDSSATLLFSRFEWTGEAPPWADCSLWLSRIIGGVVGEPERFPARRGLVGRCQPVEALRTRRPSLILPLYHEKPAYGALYIRRGLHRPWERSGTIGKEHGHLMQPALWTQFGDYHVLCRNYTGPSFGSAYYSKSRGGRNWSTIKVSPIENYNNSIVVVPTRQGPWIVWNATRGRSALTLGRLGMEGAVPTVVGRYSLTGPGEHGAYPNWGSVDGDLHLVWQGAGVGGTCITHQIIEGFFFKGRVS